MTEWDDQSTGNCANDLDLSIQTNLKDKNLKTSFLFQVIFKSTLVTMKESILIYIQVFLILRGIMSWEKTVFIISLTV